MNNFQTSSDTKAEVNPPDGYTLLGRGGSFELKDESFIGIMRHVDGENWSMPIELFGDSEDFFYAVRKQPVASTQEKGVKFDSSKPLAGCLATFPRALEAVVSCFTYGAGKYSRDNWQDVPGGAERYYDAFWRHLLASGKEELDSESGLAHIDHAIWNLMAHRELALRGRSK